MYRKLFSVHNYRRMFSAEVHILQSTDYHYHHVHLTCYEAACLLDWMTHPQGSPVPCWPGNWRPRQRSRTAPPAAWCEARKEHQSPFQLVGTVKNGRPGWGLVYIRGGFLRFSGGRLIYQHVQAECGHRTPDGRKTKIGPIPLGATLVGLEHAPPYRTAGKSGGRP